MHDHIIQKLKKPPKNLQMKTCAWILKEKKETDLKKKIPEDYRNFKESGEIKVHTLPMLQAWSRGALQKSSIFAGYLKLKIHLSYRSQEMKAFSIFLKFHPLNKMKPT